MSKLISSLEKGNFWQEHEKVGKDAYERHWNEHPVENVLGIICDIFNRVIFSFMLFGVAALFWIFFLYALDYGLIEYINGLTKILSEVKSVDDFDTLINIWIIASIFYLIANLVVNPIKSKATKVREFQEGVFYENHKKYLLTVVLKPINEEVSQINQNHRNTDTH